MRDLERRVRRHLVLDLGFSRRNAEIAIEMFRAGELNNAEKVVIERIMLNPEPSYALDSEDDSARLLSYKGSNPVMWVADHLNHRITLAGGDRVTKGTGTHNRSANVATVADLERVFSRSRYLRSLLKQTKARRR